MLRVKRREPEVACQEAIAILAPRHHADTMLHELNRPMDSLSNLKKLEKLLQTEPREVCIAIAARAALRVLPTFASEFSDRQNGAMVSPAIVLPIVRAMALPLAVATYPTRGDELRAAFAVAARDASDVGAFVTTAVFAADAAFKVVQTFSDLTYSASAADAVRAAAKASAIARSRFIKGPPSEMDILKEFTDDLPTIAGSHSSKLLAGKALWSTPRPPEWVRRLWPELKMTLHEANQDWDAWTRWYDAILEGRPTPGGEELDIYRVTLDSEEDWEKGPAHVNNLIKVREETIARWGAIPGGTGSIVDDSTFDFGEQSNLGTSFGSAGNGPVDVLPQAGATAVLRDRDTIDNHSETVRLVQELIAVQTTGRESPNNANARAAALGGLLLPALGRTIEDIRPGLLIPRGEAMRQLLLSDESRDEMSDLAPLTDAMSQAVRNFVSAYNVFVSLDPELARRDEARLGPDAQRSLVSPEQAKEAAQAAADMGAATQDAADAIRDEVAIAPPVPIPENRNSRRLSVSAKNLARALLRPAQAAARWVRQNPGKSSTVLAAMAAKWVVLHEAWLTAIFADYPAMVGALKSLVAVLKLLPFM